MNNISWHLNDSPCDINNLWDWGSYGDTPQLTVTYNNSGDLGTIDADGEYYHEYYYIPQNKNSDSIFVTYVFLLFLAFLKSFLDFIMDHD